jgi:hypothetical protein
MQINTLKINFFDFASIILNFSEFLNLSPITIQSVTNVTICGISKIDQIKVHIKWKQETLREVRFPVYFTSYGTLI